MKNQKVLIGMILVALVSACGINGERGSEQAASPARATSIEAFKVLNTKSSLGDTELTLATGYINSSEPDMIYIGDLHYEITKTTHNLVGSSIDAKVEMASSSESFGVYLNLKSPPNQGLVVTVSDAVKEILLNPILHTQNFKREMDGVSVCDRYKGNEAYSMQIAPASQGMPAQMMNPYLIIKTTFDCDIETANCTSVPDAGVHYDAKKLEADPAQYICIGKRGIHFQKKITAIDSEVVTAVVVTIQSPGREIQIAPAARGKKAASVSFAESQISFAL